MFSIGLQRSFLSSLAVGVFFFLHVDRTLFVWFVHILADFRQKSTQRNKANKMFMCMDEAEQNQSVQIAVRVKMHIPYGSFFLLFVGRVRIISRKRPKTQ